MNADLQPALDPTQLDGLLAIRLGSARKASPDDMCPDMEAVASVLAGLADPAEIETAAQHLRTCARCRQATELLREPESQRESALEFAGGRPRWALFHRLAWVGGGAVLVLVVGLLIWQSGMHGEKTPEFSIKGASDSVAIAVLRDGQRFRARHGDRLLAGDRLGFFYSAVTPGYLALFSLGEDGEASLLFPKKGPVSERIHAGTKVPLPDGGVVREAKGCEWLVGVFSDHPLSIDAMKTQLGRSANASRPGCELEPRLHRARTVWVFPFARKSP